MVHAHDAGARQCEVPQAERGVGVVQLGEEVGVVGAAVTSACRVTREAVLVAGEES